MEEKRMCINCMAALEAETLICPHCNCNQIYTASAGDLCPGTVLQERYYVGKALSANGESITYSAYDMVNDTRVSLREFYPVGLCSREKETFRLVPGLGNEPKYKSLMLDFVDLAKVLARSRSLTAVIPVQDMFEENNTVYMVSPYVEAITLKDYLLRKGGELPWETCKAMFAPVISALNTIHSSVSQYHLGLSPETILVDKNEQLRLSGFSIEALRTAKSDLVPELSAGYAAPEQYNSSNWIGPWTDVYALAAVMYKCVTGTQPPESSGRIMGETLLPANKLVKTVPINISNILFKAMSISPEKRTQSVEDLIAAFTEKADFEPVVTDEPKKTSKLVYVWIGIIALCLGICVYLGTQLLIPMMFGEEPSDSSAPISIGDESSSEISSEPSSELTVAILEDYVGKKYEDVEEDLKAIAKVRVKKEFSDKVEKGVIIKQTPDEGSEVTLANTVIITVSKGPEFMDYTSLVGNKRTWAFVQAKLKAAGIKEDRITVEYVNTADPSIDGTVLRFETAEEGKIEMEGEDPIVIFVSKYEKDYVPEDESDIVVGDEEEENVENDEVSDEL